jgi:hypothetical protein
MNDLPRAIYVPSSGGATEFRIYRGTPTEMLGEMGAELGVRGIPCVVEEISRGLALYRRIKIQVPEGLSDEKLAALFVYALLDLKLVLPLARA